MEILNQNQYNQGIGKYKLLSSTSGVGSIITTKLGFYVLISDITKWKFFNSINKKIELIRSQNTDDKQVYNSAEAEIKFNGLNFVNDKRFVDFLRIEKQLPNLVCLLGIPHMSLNENFNTPNWKTHPINQALQKADITGFASDYMINGSHFPKWFKNSKGELKKITEWKQNWLNECKKQNGVLTLDHFAPPRDSGDFLRTFKGKNFDGATIDIRVYKTLEQTNLILICPNGHLSDVPWPNYLKWKTNKETYKLTEDDKGDHLFSNELVGPCCSNPKLKWTESKTKSEGYGSIFIQCESCGMGDGSDVKTKPKINLEGINSLQPLCNGQKPWEQEIGDNHAIPYEKCIKSKPGCNKCNKSHSQEHMQVALVTANNTYYANGFSSLFVPIHLADSKVKGFHEIIKLIQEGHNHPFFKNLSKQQYWEQSVSKDALKILIENSVIEVDDFGELYEQVKVNFLNTESFNTNIDLHENYRWQEYQCFSNNSVIVPNDDKNKGLKFNDIILPRELTSIFCKIQQVVELKITNVQLDFTRVRPKERIVKIDGFKREVIESASGKSVFSLESNELFTLPANETLGEGLFFEFSDANIEKWFEKNKTELEKRFENFYKNEPDDNEQGAGTKRKIFNNGIKHFLIHSFSHLMMRELEFSCGYPTASLKERLYISSNPEKSMSGVLIYTAEGSEGSMGGIVSQGEPEKILEIVKKGLERAITCSSDPLCWESEGQGIFDLNLSACFSCSLVSETACEEMNLGLDRRILIDEQFGFLGTLFIDNTSD